MTTHEIYGRLDHCATPHSLHQSEGQHTHCIQRHLPLRLCLGQLLVSDLKVKQATWQALLKALHVT